MNTSHTVCQIEHHAMMFAFLSKHAIRLCGNRGKDAILDAMTKFGKNGDGAWLLMHRHTGIR